MHREWRQRRLYSALTLDTITRRVLSLAAARTQSVNHVEVSRVQFPSSCLVLSLRHGLCPSRCQFAERRVINRSIAAIIDTTAPHSAVYRSVGQSLSNYVEPTRSALLWTLPAADPRYSPCPLRSWAKPRSFQEACISQDTDARLECRVSSSAARHWQIMSLESSTYSATTHCCSVYCLYRPQWRMTENTIL